MVLSVNNCWRPSTTMRKPTRSRGCDSSGRHGASGTWASISAWLSNEKLIDSPAATPDHHSDVAGRAISSSPRRRTTS